MTFKEIYEEVAARGFSDMLGEPAGLIRLKRWVNFAYKELTDLAPWPFLELTKEGLAPLTIAELGHVLSVTDKTDDTVLVQTDRRTVVEEDPTLNETGVPQSWYRSGETQIAVYPANAAATLIVRYLQNPADLAADGDTPVLPSRFHDVIVDGAVVRAYKNRDNFEAVKPLREEWERGVRQMIHALLKMGYDRDLSIERTGPPGAYLG